MQAQDKAYRAIPLVLVTINDIAEYNNDMPRVLGLVVTLTAHTRIEEEVAAAIREDYPQWAFDTTIPRLIAYAEDSRWGMPIGAYRPNAKGASAYRDLSAEVMTRISGLPAANADDAHKRHKHMPQYKQATPPRTTLELDPIV